MCRRFFCRCLRGLIVRCGYDGESMEPRFTDRGGRGSLVDSAIYRDGARVASPASLTDTYRQLRANDGSMAWIGLLRPRQDELESVAAEFDLHRLALEDAINAHQRAKVEHYGHVLFVVLRAARYDDEREAVHFGELHVFVGPDFVITVRHSEAPDLSLVRQRLEAEPELLKHGPLAVLYGILDAVVDSYVPVMTKLEGDIDEVETVVFGSERAASRRIYELIREVAEFQRSLHPFADILAALRDAFGEGGVDEDLHRHLRDVADHVARSTERVDAFRLLLGDILTVNATLVVERQNEDMKVLAQASNIQNEEVKKISAWAAILFAPTLIGTVYGMNFEEMPELGWRLGYPLALVLMAVTSSVLFVTFKRRRWI